MHWGFQEVPGRCGFLRTDSCGVQRARFYEVRMDAWTLAQGVAAEEVTDRLVLIKNGAFSGWVLQIYAVVLPNLYSKTPAPNSKTTDPKP